MIRVKDLLLCVCQIRSLTRFLQLYLEQLMVLLVLLHLFLRSNERKTVDAKNFLDGDLIESFLDLSRNRMEEIATTMVVPAEELCKRVEEMTRLH